MSWIFNILLLALYLFVGYLITHASVLLGPNSTDPNIAIAYKYSTWSAVLIWLIIGLSIVAFVLYLVYFAEGGAEVQLAQAQLKTANNSSWETTLFFILILILITLCGVLSSLTAHYIQISSSYAANTANVVSAYNYALTAAILSISIAIIIPLILLYRSRPESPPEPAVKNMEMRQLVK